MLRKIKSVEDERNFKKEIVANFKSWLKENGLFLEFLNFHASELMITKLQTFTAQEFKVPLSWSWYLYGPAVIETSCVSTSDLVWVEPANNYRKDLDPLFRKEYRHFEKTRTINAYLGYVYNDKFRNELYSAKLGLYLKFFESNKNLENSKKADVEGLYDALSRFHLSLYDEWVADEVKENDKLQQLVIDYTTTYAELIAKGGYLKGINQGYLRLLRIAHDTFFEQIWKTYAHLISANTISTFSEKNKEKLRAHALREHKNYFNTASESFAALKREIESKGFELTTVERKELAR